MSIATYFFTCFTLIIKQNRLYKLKAGSSKLYKHSLPYSTYENAYIGSSPTEEMCTLFV